VTEFPAAAREYSRFSPEMARKWSVGGRWVMSTTTRISAVPSRLLMLRWPRQTARPKTYQARGVSTVPPCLASSRLQIRLRMRCLPGGGLSLGSTGGFTHHHGAGWPAWSTCGDAPVLDRRLPHFPHMSRAPKLEELDCQLGKSHPRSAAYVLRR